MNATRSVDARIAWPLLLLACAATAQDDVPLPPRIDDVPADRAAQPPADGAARPGSPRPSGARLADVPEDRRAPPEEIVVIGESGWRLPDLGSSWRAQREAEQRRQGRIRVELFPLYDPEARVDVSPAFLINQDAYRRHGTIEIFRLRFGRRPRD